MTSKEKLIENCKKLLTAFGDGELGQTVMPEDSHPTFTNQEERLSYFTLPMALNYQRDSYKLWESALKTFKDKDTRMVFDIKWVANATEDELRKKLLKHKVALQPNKHIDSWKKISETLYSNWQTFERFFDSTENDFLELKKLIQVEHKKGFPYLSGPKIFNYWSFIISTYGKIPLTNRSYINIAPDTHVTQCSVKLGVITKKEAKSLTKDQISEIWRGLLAGTGIDPIDMHSPLWFWSRNDFLYEID